MSFRQAWVLAGAAALAACTSQNGDEYPPRGGVIIGGGNGGGGGGGDGGVDGGGAAIGRVCLTGDLRAPEVCATSGAGGISVRRGTVTATTNSDGTFALPPATERGDWLASKPGLLSTVVPYAPGAAVLIPMTTVAVWDQLRTANSILIVDGQGSLLVGAFRPKGFGKPQVVVSTEPTSISGAYYDTTNPQLWGREATGAFGMALVPGLPIGAANVAGLAPNGSRSLPQVPIVEGALTYVRLDFLL